MKKLKGWQIALLIIFYPAGIVYLIVKICNKNKAKPAPAAVSKSSLSVESDFYTKVAGVTFDNADGTSRQSIIKKCSPGEDVIFKPMPSKEYPDAIGVFTAKGKQLGFLKAELAHEMKYQYGTNPMSATISDITGGDNGKSFGVNLHIVIYKK